MPNININFNFVPRDWQKRCFELQKQYTVLMVHRRAGKTTLAIAELIIKAIQQPGLYAYVAPELNQARFISWDLLKQMTSQFLGIRDGKTTVDLISIHETEPYVQFWNGSKIRLFGADKPDRLRGVKFAGVVIDEVAQMKREVWGDIIRPALLDSHGWALFIGTPKGENLFTELYRKADEPNNTKWASAKFTCYETDALDPQDIEDYKKDVDEGTFRREMLCDTDVAAVNSLISLWETQEATKRTIPVNMLHGVPVVMGVDVARYGDDKSVICVRQGQYCYPLIAFKNMDFVSLAQAVRARIVEFKPQYVFVDGTGMGSGFVDILQSMGIPCFDINFSSKATSAEYANKRTEMWFRMAEWVRKGGALPVGSDLAKQMAMPTYDTDESGVKMLEKKKSIKERLGQSPDQADALALTFAEQTYTPIVDYAQTQKKVTDYDPRQNLWGRDQAIHNPWAYADPRDAGSYSRVF